MIKKLAVLNFFSVIFNIAVNVLAQFGFIGNTSIGAVSDKYPNLFTPAGYAFSIWSLIFISLLASSIFMLYQAFENGRYTDFIKQASGWFAVANLGCGLWVFAWLNEYIGLSVILMFLILAKLLKVIINTNMEKWDAPIQTIAFYWWPVCLFSGWIAVASIANMASYLNHLGWDGTILTEIEWTVSMIALATIVNLLMIHLRNMREFAVVGVWALAGIYFRHEGSVAIIANTALAALVLIFLNIAYHGFINRKTNPIYRLIHGQKL